MSPSWIDRVTTVWKRTERARAGAQAAVRTGTLVAGAVRGINAAPAPERPNVSRAETTVIARTVDRETAARLQEYGSHELRRLKAEQQRTVDRLPERAAEQRTTRAVEQGRGKESGGRSQGRSQGRGR